MNVVLIIEMPILRSSKASRAPLLNIQIHNNNNTIASSAKDQIELYRSDKNSTTMQTKSEEILLSGSQYSAEGSIASSCTVTPRCLTPSSPALTEKSTLSDVEMKIATSSSAPVQSPLPVAKSISARQKNHRKNKSGLAKSQGYNNNNTTTTNNNSVVASSSCSLAGGCKPIPSPRTVEEAGSPPKVKSLDSPVFFSRISLDDQLANLDLVMQQQGCFETPKGLEERRDILARLNQLVYDWVKGFALGRNMAWHKIDHIGGRIVTYGSYKLGISHQGADIDALCVAPNFISRQDYFASFYDLLSFLSEVSELRKIEEAYVPVIKFRYNGVEIDMTFTQLNVEQVPTSDLELLRQDLFNHTNLDPKCLRSLNGYRATMLITQLVPDAERFRIALRAVKLWAQGQGLYSNILGYLGGFSWAVLVAKVCIDYPNLSAPELVQTFFHVYRDWRWPEPVALIDFQEEEARHHPSWDMSSVYGVAASASWNPDRNVQERYQVMPILTPTYPHQNSTFNVTANTLKLIKEKMGVAADICDQIMEGKESWETLFQTCHMFHEYEHFLIIVASAQQPGVESPQLPIQWFGLIESKIRHLANNLEKECRSNLASARIWPKPFAKKAEKTNTIRQLWFIGLRFLSDEKFDYSRTFEAFHEMLFKQAAGFYNREMRVEAHYLLKSQLTSRLSPTEIQEIVSSQSQKAREVPPSLNSGEKTPTNKSSSYAEVATKPGGNHSFVAGNCSSVTAPPERGQHLGFPPVIVPPTSLPPPLPHAGVRNNFYASPSQAPVVPLRVHHHYHTHSHQHNHYSQHQQQRSPPIMERTWTSSNSGQVGYVGPHSSTTKYNYDRGSMVSNGVGMGNVHHEYTNNERGSTGGESSSSSTAGLDISYNSLESDNGRSISYSSDKFPPSGLVQARLHHPIDRVPYQQLGPPPGVSASTQSLPQGCNLFGTTPTYDASVPPPPSPVLSKGPPTFAATNSRPVTMSSQQRNSTTKIFGRETGKTFDQGGKGMTEVRLIGCPEDISPDLIRQWMKIFGEVIEGPRFQYDGFVSLMMNLNLQMPALLPIEGKRVRVYHSKMPYYCYNCYVPGHSKKDCPNPNVSWFNYLGWLQFSYNIPSNYFIEFRESNNNVGSRNYSERSRWQKFEVPNTVSTRSFE